MTPPAKRIMTMNRSHKSNRNRDASRTVYARCVIESRNKKREQFSEQKSQLASDKCSGGAGFSSSFYVGKSRVDLHYDQKGEQDHDKGTDVEEETDVGKVHIAYGWVQLSQDIVDDAIDGIPQHFENQKRRDQDHDGESEEQLLGSALSVSDCLSLRLASSLVAA